jgi:hypothetical protein
VSRLNAGGANSPTALVVRVTNWDVETKTGLVSQGMTEKPGEFSNWYNSRSTENFSLGLYLTKAENIGLSKNKFNFARNLCLLYPQQIIKRTHCQAT